MYSDTNLIDDVVNLKTWFSQKIEDFDHRTSSL